MELLTDAPNSLRLRYFRHREKQPLGFVSISGGAATFPADGDTIEATVKLTDLALYKSKETGRNRVTLYEHSRLT